MATKRSVICLALVFSHTFGFGEFACGRHNIQKSDSTKVAKDSKDLTANAPGNIDSHILALVSSLSSEDETVRVNAERELVSFQTSQEKRKIVIQELLESVRQQGELDGTHTILTSTVFVYWRSVTQIFAELKASEAIDAMIKCVHCSNGYTGTMGEPQASYALVRMGDIAVPKLSEALLHEPDGYKRVKIVLCLSRIGGPKTRQALKRALRFEKEKAVREHIEFALYGRSA